MAKQQKPIGNQAEALAVGPGLHRVKGTPGLMLKKGANGGGSWIRRYRLAGKRRWAGLGSLGEVSLAEARKKAQALTVQRDAGIDPIDARAKEKANNLAEARAGALEAKKVTFRLAAEEFLEAYAPSWRHRYARQNWWNPLRNYAFPVIGDMLLDDIQIEQVVAVMRAAEEAGAKQMAKPLRAQIQRVLNAAIAKGQRDATRLNPADAKLVSAVRPFKRKGEQAHYRRLALDDAPAVFRSLKELAAGSTTFAAWTFMIATAARPSEALSARWCEIDLGKRLWTIPATRMKGTKAHIVPLSSLALEALGRQATVRTGDAVFPRRSGSPLSYNAFATGPKSAGIDAATPHGWRSVFRDACGDRLRVDRDLAEAALSHTLGGVEGAYRRETAVEARRPVMEAYAKWLLDEGADVIAFPATGS